MTDLASMEVKMNQQQLLTTNDDLERYLAECILVEQLSEPGLGGGRPRSKVGGGGERNGKHGNDGVLDPMIGNYDVTFTASNER